MMLLKLLIDINHPAHVHFFKHFIWEMEKRGHEILITASEKEVATALLNAYQLPFLSLGSYGDRMLQKIRRVPLKHWAMYRAVKPFKPDFFLGLGSIRAAHLSWLLRKPCMIFDDDEYSYPYYHWFVNHICVFSGFKLTGRKIIKVPGYKELAYLHPNRFKAERATEEGKIVLLRFVAWTAFHDGGKHGLDMNYKRQVVGELSKYARVYISAEGPLPPDLEQYRVRIPPQEMHSFLAKADLLFSESGTMTTEAAVLGIPVVRCNSLIGDKDDGNFIQLEDDYQLIYNIRDPEAALQKALELISTPGVKDTWKVKRQRLLREKIDVTAFMVWLVENFPDSFNHINDNQPFQTGGHLPPDIPVKEWVVDG